MMGNHRLLVPALLMTLSLVGAGPVEAAVASGDSVPTNLWLTRSLMEDIATDCSRVLGPGPVRILLDDADDSEGAELFRAAVQRVLSERGDVVFLYPGEGAMTEADARWRFRVVGVELDYPRVGRTLGLWKNWIAREMGVTVSCSITTEPEGRVLLDEILERRVSDRFGADDLDRVDSSLYSFTTAEPVASGWHGRLEEMVVLGTLAGLVAVYFANTSN